ncbi:MAG: ferrous iron transport protein B [Capsulimonadaceae bacterium]|nr:ferrous iron transport protein B [Capsulimonadaceae bacterium]
MPLCCNDENTTPVALGARRLAVVGNPNSGKTTLFNALTGLKQKVGNYPGVTVERKEGMIRVPSTSEPLLLIDLPGLYSLTPRSPDEVIARDVLLGRLDGERKPDAIVNIVDASNIERNLYLTTQLLELGLPMLVVLTMTDIAARDGKTVDETALSKALGVPVTSVQVQKGKGVVRLPELMGALPLSLPEGRSLPYNLPPLVTKECDELRDLLRTDNSDKSLSQAFAEAVTLLMVDKIPADEARRYNTSLLEHVREDQETFASNGIDFATVMVESRYGWIEQIRNASVVISDEAAAAKNGGHSLSERVDMILLHRFWGYVIFFGLMALVFQAVFTWAQAPMNLIGDGQTAAATFVQHHYPAGPLRDLITDGVISGVGTTVTFLPQILILFFFLSLLEDTGYLARAAFLMDKLMSKVGLHGKSFIPMLSSFACAIPGIMATRTINDRKSRLVTILVSPLMSCSARLPVYSLMIAAFISARYRGLTMICMYLTGTIMAFAIAWLFKKTLLRSAPPRFFIELPPYHMPAPQSILLHMLDRSLIFLRRAGTIILTASVLIWGMTSYPHHAGMDRHEQLIHSYAGMTGRVIEPLIAPLGFDWRIGISLVSSFAAREVFVSSMSVIYSVGDDTGQLAAALRSDPKFSPLLGVCVMIYYVLAMQCLSTVAVVKRETNGWKWPIFMIAYMSILAWVVTFLVWRLGSALHLGAHV